jgi:hypothetical protein
MTEVVLNEILARFDALQQGQEELKAWRASVTKFGGGQQQTLPERQDKDESMGSNDLEESEIQDLGWVDRLTGAQTQVSVQGAASLVSLLASPPPLDLVAKQVREQVQYKGVPQTPAARQNKVDQRLFTIQKKMEIAMHQMVHQQEVQDPKSLEVIAAMLRSAWEDVQQQRRVLMAGRQAPKLDTREDDNRARLLSREEEDKIAKGRAARAQSFRANPDWRSRSATGNVKTFTFSKFPPTAKQGKGKGNGKGKGKGNNSF